MGKYTEIKDTVVATFASEVASTTAAGIEVKLCDKNNLTDENDN